MASLAAVNEYRQAQADIATLAERELELFLRGIDLTRPVEAVAALEIFLPEVIQQYGEIGAAVAADFYAELREDAGVAKAYSVVLGDAIPIEQARISTKWAVGPLFHQAPSLTTVEAEITATKNNLIDVTDRLVKQPARDTLELNVKQDPVKVKYARVPSGSNSCDFCLMLASRGAEYLTKESAQRATKYHNKCNCVPTPIWEDDELPDGYDPDALYDQWQARLEAKQG